jgi:chemotaxis protein CheX
MDLKYTNPFIDSMNNVLKTMLGVTAEMQPLFLKTERLTRGDISGIIGFGGKDISGSLVLSFPTDTALEIYGKMMGETPDGISIDVQDSIGELTNIVAGGAKKIFSEQGLSFHISIPTVVIGNNHSLGYRMDIPTVVIPFKIGTDNFTMEISMKINSVVVESNPLHKR